MITISGKLFGFISLGTTHIKLSQDLEVAHFKFRLGPVDVMIETGPRTAPVPAHSTEAVKVAPHEVEHEPTHPEAPDVWN